MDGPGAGLDEEDEVGEVRLFAIRFSLLAEFG